MIKRTIFDIPIFSVRKSEIVKVIEDLIKKKNKISLFYVNAYCLLLANEDVGYRSVLKKATFVYSGGWGPVMASRILGQSLYERTPTPDFIFNIFELAQKHNWSFYFLGSSKDVITSFSKQAHRLFPRLQIKGFYDGFFTKLQEEKIIRELNTKRPTILLVGMGSPRQEKWIAENMDKVNARVFWSVGAMFDVLSGRFPRAPRWMQKLGLEWLFRLFQEPRRLWKRYLIGNVIFLFLIIKEVTIIILKRVRGFAKCAE